MLKVDIRDIQKTLGAQMGLEIDEPMVLEGAPLAGNVKVEFRLTNAGSRVLVEGRIRTVASLQCVRCAEAFVNSLDVEVHEEFLPQGSPEATFDTDLRPEELSVFTYVEDRIDVEEVIRQNIIASLPIKALCKEECQGLCPGCGANRNENPCQCEETSTDPRPRLATRRFNQRDRSTN